LADLVAVLETVSPVVWVGGGWGVDALVRQTRPHGDLDGSRIRPAAPPPAGSPAGPSAASPPHSN
jgi:hypothetical protein